MDRVTTIVKTKQLYTYLFILIVLPLLTAANVQLAQGQTADGWTATFWNNTDLVGGPVLQHFEHDVNHSPELNREWDQRPPWPTVNQDQFSARYERDLFMQPGRYRFVAKADDGVRVWVNGELIIDEWIDQVTTGYIGHADIKRAGNVNIRVEYYDDRHHAQLNLTWRNIQGTDAVLTGRIYEPTISDWRGEYFNNRAVAGVPNLVRNDASINFDWNLSSPAIEAIQQDSFSVRWTRSLNLPAGRYTFTTQTDDGVRLYANGQLLIDQWQNLDNRQHTAELNHGGGWVNIKMEYFDDIGAARAKLDWEKTGDYTPQPVVAAVTGAPTWHAEYFNNTGLTGSPVLVRQDPAVNFDWGFNSPHPARLTREAFSARWSGMMELPAGKYRFTTTSDDGVRLWVNNQQIINKWRNSSEFSYSAEVDLPGGRVPVKMEYFNAEKEAVAKLSLERLDGPLPSQPLVATVENVGAGGRGRSVEVLGAIHTIEGALTEQAKATIVSGPINVRAKPSMLSEKIGRLRLNSALTVYGRNSYGNWLLVDLADGRTGWISRIYTDLVGDVSDLPDVAQPYAAAPTVQKGGSVSVVRQSEHAVLHDAPNLLANRLGQMPLNSPAEVLGRNKFGTWLKVELADGDQGWVSILYVTTEFAIKSLPILDADAELTGEGS